MEQLPAHHINKTKQNKPKASSKESSRCMESNNLMDRGQIEQERDETDSSDDEELGNQTESNEEVQEMIQSFSSPTPNQITSPDIDTTGSQISSPESPGENIENPQVYPKRGQCIFIKTDSRNKKYAKICQNKHGSFKCPDWTRV